MFGGPDLNGTEFTDPVGYSVVWLVVCLGLVAVVVGYYYAVARWAAAGETDVAPKRARDPGIEPARNACTARLASLERAVVGGGMPVRTGFLELSAAVRTFVEAVGRVPARSMTLEELRQSGEPRVAAAIEVMYPGEFAPDDAGADDFRRSLQQARELVVSWT